MEKNNIKRGSRIMIILLLIITMTAVYSFGDREDELNQQIEQNQQQSQELEQQMQETEAQLEETRAKISELSAEMETLQSEIDANEEKLAEQQEALSTSTDEMNERLRAMYKNGSIGFIDVILSSGSVGELVANLDMVRKIYASDRDLVSSLKKQYDATKETQAELDSQQEELSAKSAELSVLEEDIYDNYAAINADKETVDAETAELNQELEGIQAARAAEAERQRQAAEAERQRQAQAAASSSGSSSSSGNSSSSSSSSGSMSYNSAASMDLVSYACQFVGKVPYVWGGTSTSGWDCSGFVQYVYRQYGVNLPRTSQAQGACGRAVPNGQQQPGDLVCYGGHVGIYIGNGQLVHASSPSVGTVIYPLSYRGGYWFRRVL